MADVTLHVVSDFVCPWCWVGKKRLDAARQAAPEVTLELKFAPYELDPAVPRAGMPYADYMAAKFSGANVQRWANMRTHLEALGVELGIPFDFAAHTVRPNTRDAHRLMRWASGQDLGEPMADALFAAYFERREDIGAADVLSRLAATVGLDGEVVADLLATDRDLDAVAADEEHARQIGVTGVPTFIRNGRHALVGAHDASTLARFLRGEGG